MKILIASYLSRIMAKPLEKLSADILLVVQLNHLINEVLIAQIEQQKSLINVQAIMAGRTDRRPAREC